MKHMSLKTLLHNNNNTIGSETIWKIFPQASNLIAQVDYQNFLSSKVAAFELKETL